MSEDLLSARRKRLIHRARYRGFKEADLLIGGFAAEAVPAMSDQELDQFEALIALSDHDLFNWVTGKSAPPADIEGPMLERLKAYDIAARINPQ